MISFLDLFFKRLVMSVLLDQSALFTDEDVMQQTKRLKFTQLHVSLPPPNPETCNADRMASATAVNSAGGFTLGTFLPTVFGGIDEPKYRYEELCYKVYGAREVDLEGTKMNFTFTGGVKPPLQCYEFNEDHYMQVNAEAKRGYHQTQSDIKRALRNQQMVGPGAQMNGRQYGFERDVNAKVFPALMQGLPYEAVEPNIVVENVDRINDAAFPIVEMITPIGF